ncbi:MAG: hypothetical protein EPN70_00690 [Paraburkholderia sp.]|uniref:primase-helicase family protein n=1 Tax=Paraburkholderia sp. TaxID=1926495 RepID=UPI00121BA6A9|nr:primase-helicase family protein [Paraburkholderia sp.]TAM08291.1 MAG: hypothetical protein EPN70_00690 [Paraburkholderia sp.]TAM28055.1 MAG: hypothetical protein EPN59_17955 [Paraburkholderia sp.]
MNAAFPYPVDIDTLRQFIQLARPSGGALTLLHIAAAGGAPQARTFDVPAELDALIEYARQHNAARSNIYWLPNAAACRDRKPAKGDMTAARFAWADCDPDIKRFGSYDAARVHLTGTHAAQLEPVASFVIDSGNGLQAFFRLAQPVALPASLDAYERINQAVGEAFAGPGTFNVDRIMRVPGTWNWPTTTKRKKGYPEAPGMARIVSASTRTFTLEQLGELVKVDEPGAPPAGVDADTGEVDAERRFADLLKTDVKLRDRWAGGTTGLADTSGSAMDLSLYAMLIARRFAHDDIVTLMAGWQHGSASGRAQGARYWDRLRGNTEAQPVQLTPADKAVHELNQRHAYVLLGGSGAVLNEHESGADFIKLDAFRAYYANQLVPVESVDKQGREATKWAPVADVWLRHRERRTFDGIEFAPGGARRGWYNLWRGFAVEQLPGMTMFRAGLRCRRFLSHVKYNVCHGNREQFRYFMQWCADMVQRPDEKPGVAVAISGEKGTGKTKVVEVLAALLGRHALSVSQPEHLVGRFNAHQAQALLVAAEESFWAGDKKAEGALKHLITSPSAMMERKGVDAVEMQSLTRFMFVGNAEWIFPATADERRLFAMTCGNRRQRDYAYFRAIDDQMYGAGLRRHKRGSAAPGLQALLTFLAALDLSRFEIRAIPETIGLREQRAATFEPHEQFFRDCLTNQEIGGGPWTEESMRFSKQALYQVFADSVQGRRFIVNQAVFGRWIKRVFGWKEVRIGSNPREWVMSGWSAARDAFADGMKVEIELDDDEPAHAARASAQEIADARFFACSDDGSDLA